MADYGRYDFKPILQGNTLPAKLVSCSFDLTGYELFMVITCHSNIAKRLTLGNGLTLVSSTSFRIEEFIVDLAPQTYEYRVDFKAPSGTVKTYIKGTIRVLQN